MWPIVTTQLQAAIMDKDVLKTVLLSLLLRFGCTRHHSELQLVHQ